MLETLQHMMKTMEPILYFNRTLPIKIVFDEPIELIKGKENTIFS